MKRSSLVRTLFVVVCLHAIASAANANVMGPRPVSPGWEGERAVTAERCPTFSWSAVPGAWGYEIAVDRVPEDALLATELVPAIRATIPSAATSWTPSLEQCLAPGASYVWSVREQRGFGTGEGEWSAPMTFMVDPAAPGPPEWERLIEEITKLKAALEAHDADDSGSIEAQDITDDILAIVKDAVLFAEQGRDAAREGRNAAENIQTWKNSVGDLSEVKTAAEELLGIDLDEKFKLVSEGAGQANEKVQDLIEFAVEQVQDFADKQYEGYALFAPNDACGAGTPCADFQQVLIGYLEDLQSTIMVLLECDLAVEPDYEAAVQLIPPRILFVMHQVMNAESGGFFGCGDLEAVGEDLVALMSTLAQVEAPPPFAMASATEVGATDDGDLSAGCALTLEVEDQIRGAMTRLLKASRGLSFIGAQLRQQAKNQPDFSFAIWGWAGLSINAGDLEKVAGMLFSVADNIPKVVKKAELQLSKCAGEKVRKELSTLIAMVDNVRFHVEALGEVPAELVEIYTQLQGLQGLKDLSGVPATLDVIKGEVSDNHTSVLFQLASHAAAVGGVATEVVGVASNLAHLVTFVEDQRVRFEDFAESQSDPETGESRLDQIHGFHLIDDDQNSATPPLNKLDLILSGLPGQSLTEGIEQILVDLGGLGAIGTDLASLRAEVEPLSGQISSLGSSIASQQAALASQHESIATALEDQDASMGEAVDGVARLQQEIESLRERLGGIESAAASILRRDIEARLATCEAVVSLFLPASSGGSLEQVVEIASTSIALASEAGLDTKNAANLFSKGEGEIAGGRYGKAWELLCRSYQALASGG